MENYIHILKKCPLFYGLKDDEILHALKCFNAYQKSYKKGNFVFSEGETADFIGIVLSGECELQKIDYTGNYNIVMHVGVGGILGASAVFSSARVRPLDAFCKTDCVILVFFAQCLSRTCARACAFHALIIDNMLKIIADKNLELTQKIELLSKRTIREKLLSFLYSYAKKAGSSTFNVKMSGQDLADYLSVNRSAMLREIANMKEDGLLEYNNRKFTLLDKFFG